MNDTVAVLSAVAAIAAGTPLVFASVGEILAERSGVLNLGVEGMMLTGAVSAFGATQLTGSLWVGVLAGVAAGALVSLLHAVLAITVRANQIVSGLALVIFGTGLSTFIGRTGSPPLAGQAPAAVFRPILREGPADLPIVGPIVFGHDPFVYLSWAFVAAASYYLFRTRPGLATRAVGEDPAAADAAGLSVSRIRYLHVMVGGAAAGAGGSYFSLALVPSWQDNITAGAGWIAIGLVIFAGWRPWWALFASYLFGAVTRLNFTLQTLGVSIPAEVLGMMPYLLTIVALILISSGTRARLLGAPAALGLPYVREER